MLFTSTYFYHLKKNKKLDTSCLVSLYRWTTRQANGCWRTWIPWMTMWLHCSTSPQTSLCLSSGRMVSRGRCLVFAFNPGIAAPLRYGNIIMLLHSAFFLSYCLVCGPLFFTFFLIIFFLKSHWWFSFHSFPCVAPLFLIFVFYCISEVHNCQRAYFYQRFPILHSDPGEKRFLSFL